MEPSATLGLIARVAALIGIHAFTWWGTIAIAAAIGGVVVPSPGSLIGPVVTALTVSALHVTLLCWVVRTANLRGWPLVQVLVWVYALLTAVDALVRSLISPPADWSIPVAFAIGSVIAAVFFVPLVVWFMGAGGRAPSVLDVRRLLPRLGRRDLMFRFAVLAAVVVPGLGLLLAAVLTPIGLGDSAWSAEVIPVLALRGAVWVVALIPLLQILPPRPVAAVAAALTLAILPVAHLAVIDMGLAGGLRGAIEGTVPVALLAGFATAVWFRRTALAIA